jgi:hypothetical protein
LLLVAAEVGQDLEEALLLEVVVEAVLGLLPGIL